MPGFARTGIRVHIGIGAKVAILAGWKASLRAPRGGIVGRIGEDNIYEQARLGDRNLVVFGVAAALVAVAACQDWLGDKFTNLSKRSVIFKDGLVLLLGYVSIIT